MDNAYIVTFPMVMAGLVLLAVTILGFIVRKWLADSDKVQAEKDILAKESFQLLHGRCDELRERREQDLEKVHRLELEIAQMVKREEMTELRTHIDQSFQKVIEAVMTKGKV